MIHRLPVVLVIGCFLLQLLLVVHPVDSKRRKSKPTSRNQSAFNHYVFAVNNKEGFCNTSTKCLSHNGRAEPWTIHGLWPSSSNDSNYPTSCLVAEKFSEENLSSIQERLNEQWPSFVGKPSTFWYREWTKHGSCAVNRTHIRSVFDYFNTTLEIHRKLNVTKFLANDNIVPRTTPYKTNDFTAAVRNDLKDHNINVMCRRAGNISVVVEVRICLNETDLSIINCPRKQSNCRKKLYYMPPVRTFDAATNATEVPLSDSRRSSESSTSESSTSESSASESSASSTSAPTTLTDSTSAASNSPSSITEAALIMKNSTTETTGQPVSIISKNDRLIDDPPRSMTD